MSALLAVFAAGDFARFERRPLVDFLEEVVFEGLVLGPGADLEDVEAAGGGEVLGCVAGVRDGGVRGDALFPVIEGNCYNKRLRVHVTKKVPQSGVFRDMVFPIVRSAPG